jgi:CopG family nickel-responsive transcriptional regulator
LLVQGPAAKLKDLCDSLRAIRGVHQLQLVTTTALLPPLHEQDETGSDEAVRPRRQRANREVAAA